MGDQSSFYQVLGLPQDASSEHVRRAYRSLVRRWHSNKNRPPPSSRLMQGSSLSSRPPLLPPSPPILYAPIDLTDPLSQALLGRERTPAYEVAPALFVLKLLRIGGSWSARWKNSSWLPEGGRSGSCEQMILRPGLNMVDCSSLMNFRALPCRCYRGFVSRTCSTAIVTLTHSSPITLFVPPKLAVSARSTPLEAPQRSEEWFALRRDKLTTSTFSTALGFWKAPQRAELWHEKVFLSKPVVFESAAKAAMNWGVTNEPGAIEQYKSITGRDVGILGFAIHADNHLGWLGASPDGILGGDADGGILEVKCPYNKGKPDLALPWQSVPYYYMPQLQGQMEIMDRYWVDLYCWTLNGSAIFRVFRSREYWRLMHEVLYNFWWDCVIPARNAVVSGNEDEAKLYRPKPRHDLTGLIISRSSKLAAESKIICRDIGGHLEFYT